MGYPSDASSRRASSGASRPPSGRSGLGEAPRRLGRYELLRELGRGANGAVYLARHDALGKEVALKVLHGHASDPEGLARFKVEAQAMGRLDHPGVVSVFDFGVDRVPYYVMEYCRGETLQQRLLRGPLPPHEAAALVAEVAGAVAAVNAQGVIHRDLKPGNVLLDERTGRARITDFGLAHDQTVSRMTQTGEVLGTPVYMAPEQIAGDRDVDQRIDVYALGVLLYQCLTGRRPFEAPTWFELRHQIQSARLVSPSELRPETPQGLSAVCLRAMARDRDDRYPDAGALAADLAPWTDPRAGASPSPGAAARGSRRLALGLFLAAIPVAALAGAGLVSLLGGGGEPPRSETSPAPEPSVAEAPPSPSASATPASDPACARTLAAAEKAAREREPTKDVSALLDAAAGLARTPADRERVRAARVELAYRRGDLAQALDLAPTDGKPSRLLLIRALACAQTGREREALPALFDRLETDETAIGHGARAVRYLFGRGPQSGQSIYLLRRALEEDATLTPLRVLLVVELYNDAAGRRDEDGRGFAEVQTQLERVLKDEPDNVMALHLAGKLLVAASDFDGAHRRYAQARALGRAPSAEIDRAEAYLFKAKPEPERALEDLEPLVSRLRDGPLKAQGLFFRGLAYGMTGDYAKGGADWKALIELGGEEGPRALRWISWRYRRAERLPMDVAKRLAAEAGATEDVFERHGPRGFGYGGRRDRDHRD
ncbi:MAG: protein kinase [Planctomycetota bacterium]